METKELLKKVKKIQIKTRKNSQNIFSGEYRSSFKGQGMTFSEVRAYQIGDEIRTIDWNVTARLGSPYIKVFEEERESTLFLLIDVSASVFFGSHFTNKKDRITELVAVLGFSALHNKDKVGAVFFSNHVEKWIPAKKGTAHILRILRDLIDWQPQPKSTHLEGALRAITQQLKKKSLVILLSDFLDENYERRLKIAAQKHDLLAIQVQDEQEENLPNIGFTHLLNPETRSLMWINTGQKKWREYFKKNILAQREKTKHILKKSGVPLTIIRTDQDYVKPLLYLFKNHG